MAVLRYNDAASVETLLSTELNGLTDGNSILSDPHDNTSDLDIYADFELLLTYAAAPPSGIKVCDLYIIPTLDGLNYASASASVTPQRFLLVGAFESAAPDVSTPERLILTQITIPPREFRVLITNTAGQTWGATGNTLRMRKYKLESL